MHRIRDRNRSFCFIRRLGSFLKENVDFYCCIVDGVFEPAANTDDEAEVVFERRHRLIRQLPPRCKQFLATFVCRVLIDKVDMVAGNKLTCALEFPILRNGCFI